MSIPAEAPEPSAPSEGTGQTAPPASPRSRLADLGPRVLSALILTAAAIVTLLTGGIAFLIAWLAASLAVHFEWQQLIGGPRPMARLAVGSLAILAAAFLAYVNGTDLAVLVLGLGAAACAYLSEKGKRGWSAAGVLYAGSLIVSVLVLRLSFPFGARAVGWLFAVVWGSDVVAYFAGRLIGGPRFAPQISPSKTWAGTLGGMVGGAALGSLFLLCVTHVTRLETPAPALVMFLLGLITSAVAQGGDLFESWTKRCFGAKDSGWLIPGHGGLMDRLDGFIAAALWVMILGALRGFPSAAEGLFHWM
ncbi:MAG: phosphatidate cytidylyltransferase [Methylovirgula sp.]